MSDANHFWPKVEKTDSCWLWRGGVDQLGYGIFKGRGHSSAHRFAYALLVGSVPDGLEIDHLCRVRHCVNPDHLEAVTHRVNVLRGTGPMAEQARQTHCKNGHEFTPENTYHRPSRPNSRRCVACHNEYMSEYKRRRRARGERVL